MANDSSATIRNNFGLLPEDKGRSASFFASTITNAIILALFIILAMYAFKNKVEMQKFVSTELVLPAEPVKLTPKIIPPPEPPKPEVVKMTQPVMPNIPAAPPKAVAPPPPPPKVGLFSSAAAPTAQANNNKAPDIKMGGFGDPNGVKPNPNATKAANIASVGGFDMPKGAETGAGRAGKGVVNGVAFGTGVPGGVVGGTGHGKVVLAGMGNGVANGVPGGTGGKVQQGSFGGSPVGNGGGHPAQAAQVPDVTPVEIISKPLPVYTSEARQMKIEGEVILEVKFTASGQVQVLRVVRGLGHGLDEAAVHVGEQIRFRPMKKNGQPVDVTTTIHVTFQLA